jgi:hypothetical protein
MDFGRETELPFGSDPLAPYVLLAASQVQQPARPGSTGLLEALDRHVNLIMQHSTEDDSDFLKTWAQKRVLMDLRSPHPLTRYLCDRRLQLANLISNECPPASALAARTWKDIRADRALSSAFDKHMIARSTADLGPLHLRHCVPMIVDIGGGPGHYSAALLNRVPAHWTCMIFDNYEQAGWYAESQIPPSRVCVRIGRSWPILPVGAGIYVVASVIHNLDDAAALRLLRSCALAASPGSRLLILERTWDSSSLADSSRDLDMRILFGGKERTDDELLALLERSGLHPESIHYTADKYRVLAVKATSR